MEVYFVRHGKTDYNNKKLLQGRTDIDLNEEGLKQANTLGRELQTKNIDFIISSPLRRAQETAYSLNLNCPIFLDDRLIERELGEYEGKPVNTYDFPKYNDYNLNSKEKGVEGIQQVIERITKFINELKVNYSDSKVVVVSHGALLRYVPCYFEGIPEDGMIKTNVLNNCEYLYYKI
jgi:broad specificity phosphatase PhoE